MDSLDELYKQREEIDKLIKAERKKKAEANKQLMKDYVNKWFWSSETNDYNDSIVYVTGVETENVLQCIIVEISRDDIFIDYRGNIHIKNLSKIFDYEVKELLKSVVDRVEHLMPG